MKRANFLMVPLLLAAVNLGAQSMKPATLNATGGSAVIGGSEFEWSVGEMAMVSTFTGSGIIVTQGVLQPAEVSLGVAETSVPKDLQVFPNPATDLVNIGYALSGKGTVSYLLLDMSGRKISNQQLSIVNGQATGQVDIRSLAAATYLLEVTIKHENGTSETIPYKIQKLK